MDRSPSPCRGRCPALSLKDMPCFPPLLPNCSSESLQLTPELEFAQFIASCFPFILLLCMLSIARMRLDDNLDRIRPTVPTQPQSSWSDLGPFILPHPNLPHRVGAGDRKPPRAGLCLWRRWHKSLTHSLNKYRTRIAARLVSRDMPDLCMLAFQQVKWLEASLSLSLLLLTYLISFNTLPSCSRRCLKAAYTLKRI